MAKTDSQRILEEEEAAKAEEDQGPPPLRCGHYITVAMWVLSTAVLYVAEFTTVLNKKRLSGVSKEFQTILSPRHENQSTETVFNVWHCIVWEEFIFVVAQLFPLFRDNKLVLTIAPWYLFSCCLQIAWIISIMLDLPAVITFGLIAGNFTILMILLGAAEIAINKMKSTGLQGFREFWLLRASFSIHAGHLLCQSLMWVVALLQLQDDNKEGVVVATSMTAMTAVLTITVVLAIASPRPDGFFCAGVSWTYWWVFRELVACSTSSCTLRSGVDGKVGNLPESMVGADTLQAFEYATGVVCFIAGCFAVLSWALRIAAQCQRNRV